MAYQLTYFNMRGRAEPIRLLFALADVPYVDIRVNHEDFSELKPTLPFGQLPILKLHNGLVLSQSSTIARFLAKKFQLHGKDDIESARIDEICDAIVDHELAYWSCCGSKLRIEHYVTVVTTKYFSKFNQILEDKSGPFLVGESVTFADIRLVNHIEFFCEMTETDLIEHFAHLRDLVKSVNDLPRIMQWKSKRAVSSVQREEEEYDKFHKS